MVFPDNIVLTNYIIQNNNITHIIQCLWQKGGTDGISYRSCLLDAIVLAVVSMEETGTYGYRITQDVRKVIDVSESTLYPVLRRLQKDECLEVYDKQYDGRNRRYYKTTEKGVLMLELYRSEWMKYSKKNY